MKMVEYFFRLFPKEVIEFVIQAAESALGRKLPYSERNKRFRSRMAKPHILEKIVPPASPSEDDIAIFRKYIKNVKPGGSLLLLGSTPKIRELLQSCGKEYTIADFSYHMISGNLKISKNVDPAREIWMKINWHDLPSKIRPVDFAIGDLILNQIPPAGQTEFLKKMNLLLKPGGILAIKENFVNQDLASRTSEKIIQDTLKKLSKENATTLITLLSYRLRDRFRNETKTADPLMLAEALMNYAPKNELERERLRRLLKEIMKKSRDNLHYNAQKKEEIESNISAYFKIDEICYPSDHEDAEYFPVYILRKR